MILVVMASLVEPTRWPTLFALVAGTLLLRRGQDRGMWLWAGLIPIDLRLAVETLEPTIVPTLAECGNVLSRPAIWRALEAAVVVAGVAVLARWLGARRGSLSLRRPGVAIIALAAASPVVLTPIGLVLGPMLAPPFFGPISIELDIPTAIVPALVLATSNGLLEELQFRGTLLGWGRRAIGARNALWLQAALFGVTHVGGDFLNPLVALPVLMAVAAGGLIAGIIVRRTGSLLLPVAVHIALDIPLYYAFACRLPV